MDLRANNGMVLVSLSRRNLRDLLSAPDGKELRRQCGTTSLRVVVESDETHYRNREPGPGINADKNEYICYHCGRKGL